MASPEAGTSPPDECARCHKTDFEPSTMAGWACRHCRLWHRGRKAPDGASAAKWRILGREDFIEQLLGLCDHIAPDQLTHRCDNPNEIYENEWERCGGCHSCLMDQMRSLVEQARAHDDSSGDSGEEDERTANRQATALGPLARVIHSPKTPDEPSGDFCPACDGLCVVPVGDGFAANCQRCGGTGKVEVPETTAAETITLGNLGVAALLGAGNVTKNGVRIELDETGLEAAKKLLGAMRAADDVSGDGS